MIAHVRDLIIHAVVKERCHQVILITGALGFVGGRLTRRLAGDAGLQVRVMLRPGSNTDRLPRGIPVHIMMGAINDEESLLAAMDGVHTIFHLVGTETRGRHADLDNVDLQALRSVIAAAQHARVGRIIFVSRFGADRGSAFPVLKIKGEMEDLIKKSGLAYTIIRSGVLFGQGDRFSEHIAMLVRFFPVYFVPGDGDMTIQPFHVDDLVTCLAMSLENLDMIDRTLTLGGPELLTYRRIIMRVMYTIQHSRPIISVPLLIHRVVAWFLDGLFARWPFTSQWIEILSTNQTGELGAVERNFGFRPTAFDIGMLRTYMEKPNYSARLLRYIFSSRW